MDRNTALELLKKYNKEPFHILHGLTVEGVMRYFANELGYGEDVDFWGLCGLLHDVDFEKYPEEHCKKAPELLAEINALAKKEKESGLTPEEKELQQKLRKNGVVLHEKDLHL